MTKHTEGPWVAIGSHESEGFDCYWIKAQPSPALRGFAKEVAAVTGPQGGEAESNACLISAAPDLLSILNAICAMQALRYGDATGTHLALSVLCETARAAITKATPEDRP